MAGEAISPLVSAGPFLGVINTGGQIYIPPTKAASMTNGDCEIVPKSLIAKYGRTNLFTATGLNGGVIGAIAQADLGYIGGVIQDTIMGSVPAATYTQGTAARFIWSSTAGSQIISMQTGNLGGPQDLPFTQAIVVNTPIDNITLDYQFGPNLSPMYADNYGGQTDVYTNLATTSGTTNLGYFPPSLGGVGSGAALVIATQGFQLGGQLVAGTSYSYAFTVVAYKNNTPGQESSPFYLPGATPITGSNNSITLAITSFGGAGSMVNFGGTFPLDPTVKYGINIYRYSSTQPVYYFVQTITASVPNFIDYQYSDLAISVNAQLVTNRDPAPVKTNYDWGGVTATTGGETAGNTPLYTYYAGAPMMAHQGRLWFFVLVRNSDTGYSPQLQLWYSNEQRAWEFDKVNNVFFVDIPQSPFLYYAGTQGNTTLAKITPVNPYVYPNCLYLEMPSGMISLMGVAMFWTTKRMYILFGNSPATYFFQKFGDIGCSSMDSIAYASSETTVGAFWMSENGVYFTNAQSIQYISEDIRAIIDNLTPQDRYTCTGFYNNHTYYISFPALNQTWGYRTTTQSWHGPMPYSTTGASDIPSNQTAYVNTLPAGTNNSVIAIRPNSLFVDTWFSQVDSDLGAAQTVVYQSNDQPGQNPHIEKEYTAIGFTAGVQGVGSTAVVKVTVDDDVTKTCSVTFDLTKGPTHIATLSFEGQGGGPLRGFIANISITYTTVVNNGTAPIRIDAVTVYGRYMSRNLTPTVGLH